MKKVLKYKNYFLGVLLLALWVGVVVEESTTSDSHVRIYVSNGIESRQICSGTVISDTRVMTAAHCFQGLRPDLQILIKDKENKNLKVVKIETMAPRFDQATLSGNFKSYKKSGVYFPERGLSDHKKEFKICGYAYGGDFVCYSFLFMKQMSNGQGAFWIVGTSQAYPGMSGGGVYDDNNNLIATTVGLTHEGFVAVSPLLNTRKIHNLEGVKNGNSLLGF